MQVPSTTLEWRRDILGYDRHLLCEQTKPDDYPDGHRLSRSHLLRKSLTESDLLDICKLVDLTDLPCQAGDGDPVKGQILFWIGVIPFL